MKCRMSLSGLTRQSLLGIFLLLFSGFLFALPNKNISAQIEDYIKERELGLASVAVAVFDSEKTVYENYFGYADIDKNLLADKDTVYEWGSASKILVWVSAMQLWEQGKLDLDCDVRKYFPEDFTKHLKFKKSVTMTQLMNHTAGFQECLYENTWAEEKDIKPLDETLLALEPLQVYEPGQVTAYSNWGNALAAYVVECISGIDYTEYVQKNILEPLGMNRTAVSGTHNDNLWAKNKREELQCYVINSEGRQDFGTRVAYVELYPAGAAISPLDDFLIFAKALANNDGKSPLFQNPDTFKTFYSATSYYAETEYVKNSHGLWVAYYSSTLIGHGGNTYGCTANLLFDPEKSEGIVVMVNECGESAFAYGIPELVFGSAVVEDLSEQNDVSPDISGFYVSSRTFVKGPLKMSTYLNFMPIFHSKDKNDKNNFRLPGGGHVKYMGNSRYFMDDGNGMSAMMYLSYNSKGHPVLEMETQDCICDTFFIPVALMIILMVLLAVVSVIKILVKVVCLFVRDSGKSKLSLSGLTRQSLTPIIITIIMYFLLLSDKTSFVKPFAIVSAILAGILCLLNAANGVYLIKKRRWFGAFTGLYCAFFLVFFQFCNFWSL